MSKQITEWRVADADGQNFPPFAQPRYTREQIEIRLGYYSNLRRATGESRLPKLPLRIEWRTVDYGPWQGGPGTLDLVAPQEGTP